VVSYEKYLFIDILNKMACFEHKTFKKDDDYMTPKSAWEEISHIIPQDKLIWEAFYGDGTSGKYLTELGFNVIHQDVDFFDNDLGEIVVSNPPFTKCPEILTRLKELNKPFILIMPCSKLTTQYFRKLFNGDNELQIVIPRKRINFTKLVYQKPVDNFRNACNFDCFYYCWKMKLAHSMIWLE
jgi:hypothetical protein